MKTGKERKHVEITQEQTDVFSPYWCHTRCPGCCSEHVFLLTSGKLNCLEVGSEGSDL